MKPVHDTALSLALFDYMSKDVWAVTKFGPKTHMSIYISKPDRSIETIYNGVTGKASQITWQDRTKVHRLDSGMLYEIYCDHDNSDIGIGDHQLTYIFVHDELDDLGSYWYKKWKDAYPHARENLWFSYMDRETYFDWHIDGPIYRYHHVLKNDGVTPSFTNETGDIFYMPGDAFVEYAGNLHKVKPSIGPRLHMVGSISKI